MLLPYQSDTWKRDIGITLLKHGWLLKLFFMVTVTEYKWRTRGIKREGEDYGRKHREGNHLSINEEPKVNIIFVALAS
jgi:hypothetical protein